MKGGQENLATGDVSPFPVSQQTPHNGENQNTDSPTTNNGKDKPLTDAVDQQHLTKTGESIMNTYQKSYTAFMESVCNKFNCREAFPTLKEGFKAFCEASSIKSNDNKMGYAFRKDRFENTGWVSCVDEDKPIPYREFVEFHDRMMSAPDAGQITPVHSYNPLLGKELFNGEAVCFSERQISDKRTILFDVVYIWIPILAPVLPKRVSFPTESPLTYRMLSQAR